MKRFLSLYFATLLIWASGLACSAGPKARMADEENIRETVFRYLFNPPADALNEKTTYQKKHNISPLPGMKGDVSPYEVYFLAVNGDQDPTDAFMKRFAGHKPVVKKVSASYVDRKAKDPIMYAVKDRVTHAIGKVFHVGNVHWLGTQRVRVRGGFYSGGLNAMDSLYILVRKGKRWAVAEISDTIKS